MSKSLVDLPPRIIVIEEDSDGFGLGAFGGNSIDESFGSMGFEFAPGVEVGVLSLPNSSRGATIISGLNAVQCNVGGAVNLGRTSNIDTSGIVAVSNRSLIFED
ncbi:MAG: hypothetical protein ACW99G_04110 [Candidatus Thorarchaeota archaeon]